MSQAPFLYPNVTRLPGDSRIQEDKARVRDTRAEKGEFDKVLENAIEGTAGNELGLSRIPLKFSTHATQRLNERRIDLDAGTINKINDAIDKASQKGVQESLILTKDAALIVSVPNRTVITAMDRGQLTGNVFTNIDGAVII